MARSKLKKYIPAAVVALSILAAYAFRFSGVDALSYVRTGIYLTLFVLWGISVSQRITHPGIRRMLVVVAVLMVFWMSARTVKFALPDSHPAGRYCWYLYYPPMLLIPLLTTFVAALLGKQPEFRLPKWRVWLYAAAVAMVLFVLTNDLHQLVFVFDTDFAHYVDGRYHYGAGFVPIAVWRYGGLLATLGLVFVKSRLPGKGRRILAPIIPALLLVLYHICYLLEFRWLRDIFGDLTVTECLLVVSILESCMRTGLIPSNTRYGELFAAAGISAQIVDDYYSVSYASRDAGDLDEAVMRSAEGGPVMLDAGRQLHSMPVQGGHMLWVADISELLELQSKLADIRDELIEGNDALRHEYEEEQKYRRIMEQNRLYDVLQSETQSQINEVYSLVGLYRNTADADARRNILARIILLGSYIKRRRDFVLSADVSPRLPDSKLRNALAESYRALALCGVDGAFSVETDRELVRGDLLSAAYDFFEAFVECTLDSLRAVSVTVRPVGDRLRIRIFADCDALSESLMRAYPQASVEQDEDGAVAVLVLEGGGEA